MSATRSGTPVASSVDLSDPDLFVTGRHHAAFERLRAEEPVYWNRLPDGGGFWALTRYDDVTDAYNRHGVFSSLGGAVIGGSIGSAVDSATGSMLVASDPPRQRQLRRIVHGAFATHIVDAIRTRIGSLVDAALDRVVADGGCDFAVDVAPELPAGALMGMVGLDHDQAHHLIGLTRRMIGYQDPALAGDAAGERIHLAESQVAIFDFFADLLRDERLTSGNGLIGILTRARLNGRPMSEEEILYNCMNVAVGGNETTSYTACAGVEVLTAHPDAQDRLVARPELVDPAITEVLRLASTNAYVQRIAKHDVRIGDALIRAGDSVTLWNVSANRDEARFPDPHRFSLDRGPNRHLAYGSGVHRCVGAQLAHVELGELFRRLVERDLRFAPAGPIARLRSCFILGTTAQPLRLVRANRP